MGISDIDAALQVVPDVWLLPGDSNRRGMIFASSLLLDGPQPLLVDAGMLRPTAEALRDTRLVQRLHLTHLHMDHRIHQDWFVTDQVTCPDVEADAIRDWGAFGEACGFPKQMVDMVFASKSDRLPFVADVIPHVTGVADGHILTYGGGDAEVVFLPGHTNGHSGLLFAEQRTMLVTDYDMEPFGPWYANPISDLEQYESTLRSLMARNDVDRFITSHRRGVLDRDAFLDGAQRYLDIIDQREARIAELVHAKGPVELDELTGQGIYYRAERVAKDPILGIFERNMNRMHLQRLASAREIQQQDQLWLAA